MKRTDGMSHSISTFFGKEQRKQREALRGKLYEHPLFHNNLFCSSREETESILLKVLISSDMLNVII